MRAIHELHILQCVLHSEVAAALPGVHLTWCARSCELDVDGLVRRMRTILADMTSSLAPASGSSAGWSMTTSISAVASHTLGEEHRVALVLSFVPGSVAWCLSFEKGSNGTWFPQCKRRCSGAS